MLVRTIACLISILAYALAAWIAAPNSSEAKIVTELVELLVKVLDAQGQAIEQKIKVTVVRDDARAKSPFLILNHGRGKNKEINDSVSVRPFLDNARYFVSRGYAVFMPLRIGYGATGGPDIENSGTCSEKNYPPGYEAGAQQTIAVIAYAKRLSFINPSDGLVVGQSYGGTIAIAMASKGIAGIKAAINFAGGGVGSPDERPERPCGIDRLTALFAGYGVNAKIPTLWLYSVNDKYWGPQLPRKWFKAFIDRDGRGEFIELLPYKQNGHPSFTGNPQAWRPAFERFIATCCKPGSAGALSTPVLPPLPDPTGTPEALTQVLRNWMAKHRIERASIIVRRAGETVLQDGIGEDPRAPVLLASLSKAITGACIATLVRDGKLTFETPVSKALAKFIVRYGRPADARLERVTVGQLLTHRSGFASNEDGEDSASHTVLDAYLAERSAREAPGPEYIRLMLATQLVREPGAVFAYSNAGYLLLGAIIEEATGRGYEDYCRGAVLAPAGASGALDPVLAVLWSYGGWRMTGADYLAFYETFDSRVPTLGARAFEWMASRPGKTYGRTSYPVWYGLGVRQRDRGQGLEIWHTGSWSRRLPPDATGSRNANTSTLVFRSAAGLSMFVHSTPLVTGNARNDLLDNLIRAARSITAWN